MGCICPTHKRTRIIAMKTIHQDEVFTSTTNIRSLYTFQKILGQGSFGSVKLACHNINKQLVAVKIIEKSRLRGNESMLATEIYILQRLDHPNIIKFYEVYQDNRFLYICMEHCQGGELLERIAQSKKPLNEGQVQRIMTKKNYKMISAITYIHSQGIVHRDIKPENIMFSTDSLDSEPKLIDFGLSNKFDLNHLKRLSTFVGTPIYLPPEIIEGEYDEKCDVWSIGVIFFILMCGYPPFYGFNKSQLYENIRGKQLKFDKIQWKNSTPQAQDLIVKLLRKDPKKRLSAKEALKHQWFKLKFKEIDSQMKLSHSKNQITLTTQTECDENRHILQMLKVFRNGAKFKKEVRKVLINQMNEQELQNLKGAFQKIDIDNSGTITVDELQKAMQDQGLQSSKQEIEKLIQTISFDDDELEQQDKEFVLPRFTKRHKTLIIKYSDFLAAAIDERKIFTREKLWSLFQYFDLNGLNYITREDIREAFARNGRSIDINKIDQMIYEMDPNHDGKISYEEFSDMMDIEGIDKTLEIKD